jgi:lipopolysaccharide export system protein LptC
VNDTTTALPPPAVARRAPRQPWHWRVLLQVSAYLPLVLMALLALGSWWLVKVSPQASGPAAAAAPRHEPDYTMNQFVVQRFGADGAMRIQIEGETLHHFPDTDTLEIDNARFRAVAPDGRVTLASARRAISNGDASEVQLTGGANVLRESNGKDQAIELRSEFLHAFLSLERVRSHLPVTVLYGASELNGSAMEYDNLSRVLILKGNVRAVFSPPAAKAPSP